MRRHGCEFLRLRSDVFKTSRVRGMIGIKIRATLVFMDHVLVLALHSIGRRLDSTIFHAFSQRYDRKLLLEMLETEISGLVDKIGTAKLVCAKS